jgi:Mg-chelatase subunit ChlD
MSFLSTAFLLALPLIAVPVAIHFYRGRRRDVVLWGAMQFLAAAVTKGRRMERLEELLLMALRLAAVAALVLALARPMVRSTWLGHATEREVVLVLDNSMSMSRVVGGKSAADQMREKASIFVDSLSSADGVQVLLAAGTEWATAEPIGADASGKRRLKEIIASSEPTLGTADLLDSLQAAIHLEASDQLTGRHVVVLTDGQAGSWHADRVGAWRQLGAECKAAPAPTTIEVVDCGLDASQIDNVAVTSLGAVKTLVRPNEPLELKAEITNVGDVASPGMHVQWLVGDKVMQESAIGGLEQHAKTQASTTLKLADSGIFAVGCRIDRADQLPLDQENWIVAQVAGELPVLFVRSENGSAASVSSAELFAAALGFKGTEAEAWHAVFRPEVITPTALATHAIDDYRAIVIDNLTELDPATVERLETFVRNGGGLWVALGDKIEPTKFNRDWFKDGDGLSPLALDSLEVLDKADDVAATVHPPSRDHVATMQLANTTQLDIDEARVRQHWSFAKRPAEEEPVSFLLESGQGRPLVVEKYFEQGRILVQAFPLGLEWSNLPLLKAYVVMIHDWLNYVTAPTSARYNLNPGMSIIASAPKDAPNARAEVVTSRGQRIPLATTSADDNFVFRYMQTQLPGMYRVRFTNDGALARNVPFHVAGDSTESDLRVLGTSVREHVLEPAGVHFAGGAATLPEKVESSPRREPLWGMLLAALVALLASELLMANRIARQRAGFAVSSTMM